MDFVVGEERASIIGQLMWTPKPLDQLLWEDPCTWPPASLMPQYATLFICHAALIVCHAFHAYRLQLFLYRWSDIITDIWLSYQ